MYVSIHDHTTFSRFDKWTGFILITGCPLALGEEG